MDGIFLARESYEAKKKIKLFEIISGAESKTSTWKKKTNEKSLKNKKKSCKCEEIKVRI